MKKIIDQKLEEKLKFLSGVNTWDTYSNGDISLIKMSDGPHGLRYVYEEVNYEQHSLNNRVYPTLSTLANSWNKDILYSIGKCLALDAIEQNVDIVLAPGVNLKRHPFCGRNFEYLSEDSFLAGILASSYIKGIQDKGISACIKHFACNNREKDRFYQTSEVDVRALNEEYLKAFRIAINEANPWTIMCSYNPVNGIYASENKYLLKDILRDKYHYDGVVISDWGACRNRAISLKNGLDLAMPYSEWFNVHLQKGIEDGYINEDDVNSSINRLDLLRSRLEENKHKRNIDLTKEERLQKCIEADEESIVLLKNIDDILPLKNKKENILVVGNFAKNPPIGGEGSSKVNPLYNDFDLVKKLQNNLPNSKINYVESYNQRYHLIQPFGIKLAVLEAQKNDVVIVCIGTNELVEKEESDKDNYRLNENFYELIKEISNVNKNIIVNIYSGGSVDLSPINDLVKAICYVGLGGEGINDALANILSGKISPSGKLSESFIASEEQSYAKSNNFFYETYKEGVLVGYKYYLTNNVPVLYEFGHGLSYAKFVYSNLKINKLSNYDYELNFDITNDSDIPAKEITQIYISNPLRMVETPLKSLVGFTKTHLDPHQTKNISIKLNKESFSYYSTVLNDLYVEDGIYHIYVSSSLTDVRLEDIIEINDNDFFKFSRY